MTETIVEGGALFANIEERTVRGLLLPFKEVGKSNLGEIMFAGADNVRIPRDIDIVGGNIAHDREQPVARATDIQVHEDGVHITTKVANTDEGDALLAGIAEGKWTNLSAEVKNIVRRGREALSGDLFGFAFVDKGAFASAGLYAELAEEQPVEESDALTPDENGAIAVVATDTPETVTVTVEDNETVFVPEDTTEKEDKEMAEATIPATLTAGAVVAKNDGLSLTGLFELVNKARNGDADAGDLIRKAGGESLFAALNDVKYDGTGGLNNVQLPQFVGEVWQARTIGRNVIPQFTQAALTDTTIKGWKWGVRPEVSTWAGNKANVPTSSPTVSEVAGAIQRFAGGNDIAREFYDFGKTDVIASLLAAYADSYAAKSDAWFLSQLITAAGTGTALSVPVGTPAGLGAVVQGALKIVTAGGKPSVAFVSPDTFASIVYTKKDDTLEYLNAAVGTDLTEGSTQSFSIIPRAELATGNVLVADRRAATALELPGSPIRVNALDMVKGGVDEAVFGYIGAIVNDANGLARIIPAA